MTTHLVITHDAPLVVVATRGTDAHDGTDTGSSTDTDGEVWSAGHVINATGTWSRPFWPHYPGRESFRGRQLHVHDYVRAEEFTGQRVVIVGAGISATQPLDEISQVTETFWVTRRRRRGGRWSGTPCSAGSSPTAYVCRTARWNRRT